MSLTGNTARVAWISQMLYVTERLERTAKTVQTRSMGIFCEEYGT